MSAITCPNCQICLCTAEAASGRCESCGKAVPRRLRRRPADAAANPEVRPWTPWQILAVSFAFGAAACGIVTGVNFVRMGQSARAVPSFLAGIVVFLIQAGIILLRVPEQNAQLAFVVSNLAIGAVFMLVQKPAFDDWKNANWRGDSYKPNGIGQLLLVCLGGAVIEVIIAVSLLALGQS